jgi:hypothetical protein
MNKVKMILVFKTGIHRRLQRSLSVRATYRAPGGQFDMPTVCVLKLAVVRMVIIVVMIAEMIVVVVKIMMAVMVVIMVVTVGIVLIMMMAVIGYTNLGSW